MLTDERVNRFQTVAANRIQDVVVLENIHDPHNAAAALRNCDAFGIQTVHVIFETEKMYNPEKLGKLTSASANKWLTVKTWTSSKDCFDALHKEGFFVVATAIDKAAQSFDEYQLPSQKIAIVFGNEGFGITETTKKMADTLVYIPMQGFVDSINLSVSVGVVLHDLSGERRKKKMYLSDVDQKKLTDGWINEEMRRRYRQS